MCAAKYIHPSDDDEPYIIEPYDIDYSRPGIVYIFNYINFDNGNVRRGADKDQMRLMDLFEELKFEVEPFLDKTAKQTRQKLKDLSVFTRRLEK